MVTNHSGVSWQDSRDWRHDADGGASDISEDNNVVVRAATTALANSEEVVRSLAVVTSMEYYVKADQLNLIQFVRIAMTAKSWFNTAVATAK